MQFFVYYKVYYCVINLNQWFFPSTSETKRQVVRIPSPEKRGFDLLLHFFSHFFYSLFYGSLQTPYKQQFNS